MGGGQGVVYLPQELHQDALVAHPRNRVTRLPSIACMHTPPSAHPFFLCTRPLRTPLPVHHTPILQNVASISAGNDDFIGEMIADALDKVGSNGVLSIESSNRWARSGAAAVLGHACVRGCTQEERMWPCRMLCLLSLLAIGVAAV